MHRDSGSFFNPKTIKRLCGNVAITETQQSAAKDWLDRLDANELSNEKKELHNIC